MKAHRIVVAASAGIVLLGVACVDLFHSTDFETLCSRLPNDPQCVDDSGTDAGTDSSKDAADAARPPHPDFCSWTSSEAQAHALEACAWLGACERPSAGSILGACVVRAQLAYDCGANPWLRPRGAVDDFWGCLATVKSCTDVDRCVFPGGHQDCVSDGSDASATTYACGTNGNESVKIECNPLAPGTSRAVGIEPCVMQGQTCSREPGAGTSCTGNAGFNCTTSKCIGTAATDCASASPTADKGVDCAGYGAGACVSGTSAACAPASTAPTCASDPTPACDNSVATSCVGGKQVRIDCQRLGLPCDVSTPISPLDLGAACKKVGAGVCDAPDLCLSGGKLLRSCGHGATYEISCASLNLGACKVDADGRGACGPPP